jgi:hypothetical protein
MNMNLSYSFAKIIILSTIKIRQTTYVKPQSLENHREPRKHNGGNLFIAFIGVLCGNFIN